MKGGIGRVLMFFLLATGLSACGGGGGGAASSNGTIGVFRAGESGAQSSPWGDGSPTHRPAMAVKFTPASYPATITSVTVYATNNTGSNQLFNLVGFSDLNTETPIFPAVQNNILPNTGTAPLVKTVNIPPTTIASGSFYVGVEWVTKPLTAVSGANSFFLLTDSHLDSPATSFFRFTGTIWSPVESINPTSGDLGIVVNF